MIPVADLKEFENQAKELDFSKLENLKVSEKVVIQQTEEWYQQRRFKFTSSSIYKLLVEPKSKEAKEKGELGETAKTYIMEKIAEEVGGFLPDATGRAIEWGNEHEDKAANEYAKVTGNSLEAVGFVQHTEFYGGSPDRSVLDNNLSSDRIGGLEIKCPYNSTNHLWHRLIDSAEYFKKNHPDYYWQCVSHMITLNVKWCDFVSYDPRVSPELGLFIFRLERDEMEVSLLLNKIKKALEYKEYLKLKLS
jgi:exodeoxyribonuclease (lambda-induced)